MRRLAIAWALAAMPATLFAQGTTTEFREWSAHINDAGAYAFTQEVVEDELRILGVQCLRSEATCEVFAVLQSDCFGQSRMPVILAVDSNAEGLIMECGINQALRSKLTRNMADVQLVASLFSGAAAAVTVPSGESAFETFRFSLAGSRAAIQFAMTAAGAREESPAGPDGATQVRPPPAERLL